MHMYIQRKYSNREAEYVGTHIWVGWRSHWLGQAKFMALIISSNYLQLFYSFLPTKLLLAA